MVNILEIILRGVNQTGPAFQGARDDLSGLTGVANALSGAIGGKLAGALSVTGIAFGALGAAKTAFELGALGETVTRSEKYFEAYSGSAKLAAENLAAVQRATDGAMSSQEAMNAGASVLAMGLAKNADELEKFARMATLLGGNTRTAAEAMGEFQLLLANQSIERLDTFGISSGRVRVRIAELQETTAGMTREQAFLQAVMEEGTKKMVALEAQGIKVGTSQERLTSLTKDLKAELSKLVEEPYTIVIERVIKDVSGVRDAIGQVADNRISFNVEADTDARLEAISSSIQRLEDQKKRFNDGTPLSILKQGMADIQIQELEALRSQLLAYGSAAADVRSKLDDYLAASLRLSIAQEEAGKISIFASNAVKQMATAELEAAQASRDATLAAYQAAAGYARLAVETDAAADAQNRYYGAARAAAAAPPPGRRFDFDLGLGDIASGGASTIKPATALPGSKAWNDAQAAELARSNFLRESNKSIAKSAGDDYKTAMEQAAREVSSRISDYLSQGVASARGLLDLTPDIAKPGDNGPFENIFRALDVAKLGDASPWAAQLGLTQEEARKIGADFQRGIFSEGVVGLIDVNALINEAQMADLAQKSKEAFVNAIAQKAGVGTNVVGALFGLSGGSTGPGQGNQARTMVDSALNQVAGVLGESVQAVEFAGRVTGYGEMIWGFFETGIVTKAKTSSALERAIQAMVSAALSGQTGGSVGDAVRSGGGQ